MNATEPDTQPRSLVITQMLRALCHLAAVVIVSAWALTAWPLPFPGLLTGGAALVAAVLIWALFLSPRPVLRTDRFGQALIELLLIAAAVAALLSLGAHWLIAACFGLLAATAGFLFGTKSQGH